MDSTLAHQKLTDILQGLPASAQVLDVGGWGRPLRQATHVIDWMPYDTRNRDLSILGGAERFSADRWCQRDICDRRPWPYEDKQFDFVFCAHTLEDVRDPIWVCSELARVGKRGYIEVPHRVKESVVVYSSWPRRLLGRKSYVGYSHHRWLVEIEGEEVRFFFKSHLIHEGGRYHFAPRWHEQVRPQFEADCLFWEDTFKYREVVFPTEAAVAEDLASFRERFRREQVFESDRLRVVLYLMKFPVRLLRRRRTTRGKWRPPEGEHVVSVPSPPQGEGQGEGERSMVAPAPVRARRW